MYAAASARLCVETQNTYKIGKRDMQPPPRGCVLKQQDPILLNFALYAAASARLCVETRLAAVAWIWSLAAASARLCVET